MKEFEVFKEEILAKLEEVGEGSDITIEQLLEFAEHQHLESRAKYPQWAYIRKQSDKEEEVLPNSVKNSYKMLFWTYSFFKVLAAGLKGSQNRLFNLIRYATELSKIKHPIIEVTAKCEDVLFEAGILYNDLPKGTVHKKGMLYIKAYGIVYNVSSIPRIYSLAYLYKDDKL